MKKIISTLVPALIVTLFIGNQAFGADESLELKKEKFEENFVESINELTGSEKESLELEYSKYNELNKEEQDTIVEYLNDEEIMKSLSEEFNTPSSSELTIQSSGEESENENLIYELNDDIEIYEVLSDMPAQINSDEMSIMATQRRTASNSRYMTIAGIKVFEVKSEIAYTRTGHGGRITGIEGTDHRVTRNFTVNRLNWSNSTRGYSSTKAWARSNYTIDFAYKGLYTYVSGYSRVEVDNFGKVTGKFVRN